MGKIFVYYRRDDSSSGAARLRDRLAAEFGATSVFMDVDSLHAGQRFDKELQRALAETDVFLAVIGRIDLLGSRTANDERDYVREEIAAALQRGIMVIPVLIERVGLPRGADLPDDISEMILHQKDDVTHEHFGRDVHALVAAIKAGRKAAAAAARTPLLPIRSRIAAGVLGAMLVAAAAIYFARSPLLTLLAVPNAGSVSDPDQKRVEQERKRLQDLDDQLRQEREARALAEAESKRLSDAAAQTKRELELRQVPGPATEAAPQPKLLDAREPDTPPKKPAPLEASERSRPERLDKPQRAEKPNRPDKPERQAERERPQQQPQERRPSSAAATAVPGL